MDLEEYDRLIEELEVDIHRFSAKHELAYEDLSAILFALGGSASAKIPDKKARKMVLQAFALATTGQLIGLKRGDFD